MGLDDRGIDRGKCRVEECDCTEFPASDAMSCGYCGDPPAKHQNLQQHVSSSTASSSTQNVTLSSNIDNLERLIHNASKLEQKVVTEIEKISKDNDSLFCQNGRLKSGRQSQHNFNEDTIHKMNIFIADEIKPFNKTLVELKQKCKVTSWNKRGKKRTDKQRKRENKWKVEARTKCRKLNRCKEIYELFGGHLMSECFTPEMGAYQITEIEDTCTCTFIENIFSDTLSEFDKCCLAHMVKEGCFLRAGP
ncbi:unnamed protein product [Mytilus edulis]|uniref:Uncharacterized protein n=1 Tax=Mytilus edulis TaxID=6550 RepID=A0A8S3VJA3_MYTED|nr:unnamed protein product [Mytilus edulis]